jgi:N-acetylglucosamine-6-sulfatase
VKTLAGALHETFDAFYKEQPRVSFSSCVKGHIVSEEGPQDVRAWSGGDFGGLEGRQGPMLPGTARRASFERSGRWSDWT